MPVLFARIAFEGRQEIDSANAAAVSGAAGARLVSPLLLDASRVKGPATISGARQKLGFPFSFDAARFLGVRILDLQTNVAVKRGADNFRRRRRQFLDLPPLSLCRRHRRRFDAARVRGVARVVEEVEALFTLLLLRKLDGEIGREFVEQFGRIFGAGIDG